MRRRGFTLVEAVVAALLATGVVGIMVSILSASRRMSTVGDLSSAMADGSIAMEQVHRDLTQAVQHPDPSVKAPVLFSPQKAVQFVHAVRGPDGRLEGKLVVYRRTETPAGNFRLLRRVGDQAEAPLPGIYSHLTMRYLSATGGPFVRVTMHAVANDVKRTTPAGGLDEAVLTSMVHVDAPEMLGSSYFNWDLLDGVKSVNLLKGELGF